MAVMRAQRALFWESDHRRWEAPVQTPSRFRTSLDRPRLIAARALAYRHLDHLEVEERKEVMAFFGAGREEEGGVEHVPS